MAYQFKARLPVEGGAHGQLGNDQKALAQIRSEVVSQDKELQNHQWIGETASAFSVSCSDYVTTLATLEQKLGELKTLLKTNLASKKRPSRPDRK